MIVRSSNKALLSVFTTALLKFAAHTAACGARGLSEGAKLLLEGCPGRFGRGLGSTS